MGAVKGLRCRECGQEYPKEPLYVCDFCFGPLEVVYDYEKLAHKVSREKIAAGPPSIWRYRDLLPLEDDRLVGRYVGFTPLVRAENLGKVLGLSNLYIKNDCVNPTYSFKDRVASVAVSKAVEFGFKVVACASTGNLANAVAAHGAMAGLRTFVFIPADLEESKIVASRVYNPTVVAVKGNYDQVNRLCSEIADRLEGWAFVNVNLRPYYAEGSKTLAFEVVEQLGWRAPDCVVVPMASGALLVKIKKGLDEMVRVGLIPDAPTRFFGAQAEGCSPIVRAFRSGADDIQPVKPSTIAKSLAIGNPADGYYALRVIRGTGGTAEAVSDEEIIEAIKLLARTEGIFAETAGGVTVGVLKKLVEQGAIQRDELVVAYITGNGLKTQEVLNGRLQEGMTIEPSFEEFEKRIKEI